MSDFNSDFEETAQDAPPIVHDDFINKISQSLPPTIGNWLNSGDKNTRYAKFGAIVGGILLILLIIFGGILAATYFLGGSTYPDGDSGDNNPPTTPTNQTATSTPTPITPPPDTPPPPPISPTPSTPPAGTWTEWRLPTWAKPTNYSLTVEPHFSNLTFTGSIDIIFQMNEAKSYIVLNCKEITINSVTVKTNTSKRSKLSVLSTSLDAELEILIINFSEDLSVGSYHVSISYEGVLADDMSGFYFSTYKDSNGKLHTIAATQFESTDARKAFPCFDEPSFKAYWKIYIQTDIKYKVFSNMPQITQELVDDSIYKFGFLETPLMSSYLVAFVIGDFACRSDTFGHSDSPLQVCAPIGLEQYGEEALLTAKHVLSFYEDYFGQPYSLPKLDMLAIPDFSAGAMENWGLVTYRLTDLLYDEENDSAYNRQLVATVVAHELAHQWTGDLVTMSWWSDLWLNEGFATYFETASVDDFHPEWLLHDQFLVDAQEVAFNVDALKNAHPIVMSGVSDPNLIEEMFDSITYEKGGSVLRMIEGIVGYYPLRDGIRQYIKKYKFANADTNQFLQAISKELNQDLTFLLPFLTTAGYPLITPALSNKQLTVRQERFFLHSGEAVTSSFWDVDFTFVSDQDVENEVHVNLTSTSTSAPISSSVTWIKANFGQSGFYRVNYDDKNWDQLRQNYGVFSNNLDRVSIINDALVLARAGQLSTTTALDIVNKLKAEEDYVVWKSSLSELYYIGNMLIAQPAYQNYKNYIQNLLDDVIGKIGWNEDDSTLIGYDDHVINLFRNDLFPFALNFHQGEVTNDAWQAWQDYKVNNTFISPNVRDTVYRAALYYGGEEDYWTLFDMYQQTANSAEQRRILRALGSTRVYNLLQYTLQITLDTSIVREQDRITVIAGVSSNPLGMDLAWDFVRANWATFNERGFAITSLVTVTTSKFNDQLHLDEVRDFFDANPTNGAQMTVRNCIETIQNNIDWLALNLRPLSVWLSDNQ